MTTSERRGDGVLASLGQEAPCGVTQGWRVRNSVNSPIRHRQQNFIAARSVHLTWRPESNACRLLAAVSYIVPNSIQQQLDRGPTSSSPLPSTVHLRVTDILRADVRVSLYGGGHMQVARPTTGILAGAGLRVAGSFPLTTVGEWDQEAVVVDKVSHDAVHPGEAQPLSLG